MLAYALDHPQLSLFACYLIFYGLCSLVFIYG